MLDFVLHYIHFLQNYSNFERSLWESPLELSPATREAGINYLDQPHRRGPRSLSYFFRTYKAMPKIEQKALELAHGKVLDVGCGSGSHSLYLQNEKGLEVVGIDRSAGAIEVAQQRGVKAFIVNRF